MKKKLLTQSDILSVFTENQSDKHKEEADLLTEAR